MKFIEKIFIANDFENHALHKKQKPSYIILYCGLIMLLFTLYPVGIWIRIRLGYLNYSEKDAFIIGCVFLSLTAMTLSYWCVQMLYLSETYMVRRSILWNRKIKYSDIKKFKLNDETLILKTAKGGLLLSMRWYNCPWITAQIRFALDHKKWAESEEELDIVREYAMRGELRNIGSFEYQGYVPIPIESSGEGQ
ncbi:MAG: hypothetical protein Q4P78_02375 [Rothia sp. (in: high G+C Gram-positive bacteria)]|uniref:hypothetical protein n=1 Tax=Rothia sp. (in: high G+C Gram-positive bacteria) TaxID=1885016 RepID=UPI0026E02560|nr:hypothetical protein [Rothia sp. (in: high G+C Gram-positive bacteria)]MDO5750033.1 hypothetical protein [Rothia sp. (in: high G+C Gram-positive bacteria)]